MRNGAIVSLVQRNFEVNISLLCTKPFWDTSFYEPFVYALISAQTWFYCKIASRLWFLCSCSAKNYINWSSKNGWIRVLDLHLKCKYTVEPSLTATSFPVRWGQPKTSVWAGASVLPFSALTLLNEGYTRWKQQICHKVPETSLKIKRCRLSSKRNLFGFQRRFLEIFLRCLPLIGSG